MAMTGSKGGCKTGGTLAGQIERILDALAGRAHVVFRFILNTVKGENSHRVAT
jgi:hypothetical protein